MLSHAHLLSQVTAPDARKSLCHAFSSRLTLQLCNEPVNSAGIVKKSVAAHITN